MNSSNPSSKRKAKASLRPENWLKPPTSIPIRNASKESNPGKSSVPHRIDLSSSDSLAKSEKRGFDSSSWGISWKSFHQELAFAASMNVLAYSSIPVGSGTKIIQRIVSCTKTLEISLGNPYNIWLLLLILLSYLSPFLLPLVRQHLSVCVCFTQRCWFESSSWQGLSRIV